MKAMIEAKVDAESSAWSSTGRLWDDGVIDPRDTRTVLLLALSACANAPFAGSNAWGTFRH
jgi:3-methylcrotonyl-CoA carboxylase beta subunit